MNKKISKIDINKVIVLIVSFLILVSLTMIVNNFTAYGSDKKMSSNKNEYASNNNVEVEKNKVEVSGVEETNYVQIKEQLSEQTNVDETIVKDADNQAISYFEDTENEINLLINSKDEKFSMKVKEKFVMLVDFIFYDTEINGITFDELTDETKQKLIDIVNRIDVKIEEKIPGYKETISTNTKESYAFLVDKLKQGLNYLDDKAEERLGTEKYEEIKENINDTKEKIKDNGSVVVEKGKELFGTAKEKVKEWYEGWK